MSGNGGMTEIINLREKSNELRDQIYIVAGSLGGICGVLLIATIVLAIYALQLHKKIQHAEESRRITEEIQARKFSAYTGEEVHRRLNTVNPATGAGAANSEYAFNYPVSEYKLNSPIQH